jgi:hypothetical protein
MLTFNEFLIQFSEEVNEIYQGAEMSRNAKIAVISVMREYLGNRRFDPVELLGLFESVCYTAMHKVDRDTLLARVGREANFYLTDPDYSREPDITFEEVAERRSMGR